MNNLSVETQVRLDKFKPRDYQLPLLDAVLNKGYRKVLCLWCRRSGKDLTAWNLIIRMALQQVGNYFYCLPTYRQCRLVIFDSITIDQNKFIDYIPKELIKAINIQDMKITLINGSIIQLMGSDTYDTSLIGTNPRMIVFSEWSLSDERAYQFVRPIMNANHGIVVFLSTPRGYNHFYTLYQIASNSPEWFCYKLTVEDCGHISLADIQKEIDSSEVSEDLARQEYWCDFSAGVEGSFYAKYIDRMRLKGQITDVPWEPGFQTHLAIDIGVRDSTSLIWFQCIGQTVRIIDCYQKNKEGLEHYVNVIKSKPYTMGRYIAPHDIAVKEWGSGQTRIAKAKELGIKFTLANNVGLMDGIESCRSAFGKIWIDEKNCGQLIKCLENYRQEWDSKRKVYHEKPLHDANSHFADAFRYLCVSLSKTRDNLSAEDLDRRYADAMLGGSKMPKPFHDGAW